MKKNNYFSNKLSILTVLLAATTLLSCTNRVNLLGTCQQKEEINDFSESDEYETIEMERLTIDNKENSEDKAKVEKLKQIAEKAGYYDVLDLIEKGRIDPTRITYESLAILEENTNYINECKKNENRINARSSTKFWKSKCVIIPGLCLVLVGSVILWYYGSDADSHKDHSVALPYQNSFRNVSDKFWYCFRFNGTNLIPYNYNIDQELYETKFRTNSSLSCSLQPHILTPESHRHATELMSEHLFTIPSIGKKMVEC